MASDCGVTPAHPAWHSEVTRETIMLLSTVLGGLAVLAVAFEAPVAATVFGAVALWLIGHGAQRKHTVPK
jgi:hypothetical protein